MNRLLLIIILICIVACKPWLKPELKLQFVNSTDLKKSVTYLASDELEGRDTGSEGIEKAAIFIEGVFKTNKIEPYFKTYRDSFNLNGINAYNLVGFIEGNDPLLKNEIVILGAHYDHIGNAKEVKGDSIANGANDNAAGTSAVLEVAKYFAANKSNKRSLLIALFSAEEKGLKGLNTWRKSLRIKI